MAISMPRWAANPQAVPPPDSGPTPPILSVSWAWADPSPAVISAAANTALRTFAIMSVFPPGIPAVRGCRGDRPLPAPPLGCSARGGGVKQGDPKGGHAGHTRGVDAARRGDLPRRVRALVTDAHGFGAHHGLDA